MEELFLGAKEMHFIATALSEWVEQADESSKEARDALASKVALFAVQARKSGAEQIRLQAIKRDVKSQKYIVYGTSKAGVSGVLGFFNVTGLVLGPDKLLHAASISFGVVENVSVVAWEDAPESDRVLAEERNKAYFAEFAEG